MMQRRKSRDITRIYRRLVFEEDIDEWDRADSGGTVERELPSSVLDSSRGAVGQ